MTDVVEHPHAERPAVGDLVVCIRCAGVLVITNVSTLRELRDAEFRRLTPEQLMSIAQMQQTVVSGEFRKPRAERHL